jgi:ABC-2 type transport system ATP-binding protein
MVRRGEIVVDSLSVQTGQVVGLFGANGAGKTTVLRMAAGLLAPDAGHIRLNGYDLDVERDRALQQMTVIVQGGCPLDDNRSVWENLPPGTCGWAEMLLHAFGLWEYRDDPTGCLSHGLKRQVALISALVTKRPILLLDEPTLGLDDCVAHAVESSIKTQVREQKKTVIIATCSQRLIQALCDRVAVMRAGRLAADVPVNRALGLSQRVCYRICVKGKLDRCCEDWFEGLEMTTKWDETILAGHVPDQPALHGLLTRIRDLGLPLVSLERIQPNLEQALERQSLPTTGGGAVHWTATSLVG